MDTSANMGRQIGQLLHFFDYGARWRLASLGVAMLAMAILEMASLGLVIPFVGAISTGQFPPILERLICAEGSCESKTLIIRLSGGFALIFLIKTMAFLTVTYFVDSVTNRTCAVFRQRMFGLYLNRPYAFHLNRHGSETLRNLHQNVPLVFEGIRLLLTITLECLLVLGTLAAVLLSEPAISMAAATVLIGFGLIYQRVAARYFHRLGEATNAVEKHVIQATIEPFSAIKEIKTAQVGEHFAATYRRHTNLLADNLTRYLLGMQVPRLLVELLIIFLLLGLVTFQHIILDRPLAEVASTLVLFGMASLRLMPSLNRILQSFSQLRHKQAAITSIHADYVDALSDLARLPTRIIAVPFQERIDLINLSFRYSDADQDSLHAITMSIKRGQCIGLIGSSGSGKTTLADILLCLHEPTCGYIMIDGLPLAKESKLKVAYVPQSIAMLDASIRDNIVFGTPGIIDVDALERAIHLTGLKQVIDRLPDGIETSAGENGRRLSGGQRQRVGLARALYRDADILILDEATSALDNISETEISEAIHNLKGMKTIVIIAHSLATVRECDTLYVMDQGRIVASGSYDALAADNEEFGRLLKQKVPS